MTWKDERKEAEIAQTKKFQALVGAKIISAKVTHHDENCDGVNLLILETDKGRFEIEGGYGSYTGNSCDEYYEYITLNKVTT